MVDKKTPDFDDMKVWAEKSYQMSIDELPGFIEQIKETYDHTSISKINLLNVSVTCLLNNFYQEKVIPMTEPEVETSKWTLVKMLFPSLGDGPISMLKWNNLLSPTAEPYFHSVPMDVFQDIQSSAKLLLDRHNEGRETYSDEDVAHWQSIIDGNIPFGYKIIDMPVEQITGE